MLVLWPTELIARRRFATTFGAGIIGDVAPATSGGQTSAARNRFAGAAFYSANDFIRRHCRRDDRRHCPDAMIAVRSRVALARLAVFALSLIATNVPLM